MCCVGGFQTLMFCLCLCLCVRKAKQSWFQELVYRNKVLKTMLTLTHLSPIPLGFHATFLDLFSLLSWILEQGTIYWSKLQTIK